MHGGVVIIALLLSQPTAMQAAPASPASVGQPLADRLDVAFRACALQITEPAYLTSNNQRELAAAGIKLAAPPPDVLTMATRLFGEAGIYASVASPNGNIWISASPTVAACKVTLGDTDLALSGRYDWTTRLRSSAAWQYDQPRSGQNAQIMRDFFVLNPDRPGPHLVMFVDGPHTVINDGKGIQMIMTVTLEAAKAQ